MGINKDLGLPFGEGMEKTAIAFDIDGTLIEDDKEHHITIMLVDAMVRQRWKNVDIIIWSGGGKDYARTIFERVLPSAAGYVYYHSKLEHEQLRKKYSKIIAIDDVQDTRLGDINLIVRNK